MRPSASLWSGMPNRMTPGTPSAGQLAASSTIRSGLSWMAAGHRRDLAADARARADEQRGDEVVGRETRLAHQPPDRLGPAQPSRPLLRKAHAAPPAASRRRAASAGPVEPSTAPGPPRRRATPVPPAPRWWSVRSRRRRVFQRAHVSPSTPRPRARFCALDGEQNAMASSVPARARASAARAIPAAPAPCGTRSARPRSRLRVTARRPDRAARDRRAARARAPLRACRPRRRPQTPAGARRPPQGRCPPDTRARRGGGRWLARRPPGEAARRPTADARHSRLRARGVHGVRAREDHPVDALEGAQGVVPARQDPPAAR